MMTTSATLVVPAPIALTASLPREPGPPSFFQWTTMPTCENANALNAPMAKSGMSASVTPPNRMRSNPESTARPMIPLEKTSRRPRLAKKEGRKPSCASSRHTRGKSAKLVCAEQPRMMKTEAIDT